MKYTLSFLLIAFSLSLSAKEIPTKSTIKHVTVFQKAAQIERTAQVKIPSGKHQIIISNLSTQINENSIQLRGDKQLSILSIYFQRNYLKDAVPSSKLKAVQDSISYMESKLQDVNDERWLLQEEKDLILKNKVLSQTGNNNTTEELTKRANFYRYRLREILKSQKSENQKHSKYQNTLRKLRAQQNELGNRRKHVGEIVVEIESKTTQTVNLNLAYNIQNAGWHPLYNLRSNSIEEPLQLDYNAKVYQRSGVDWENVKISLSTSNPQANIQKPTLTPWRLAFVKPLNYNRPDLYKQSNKAYDYSNSRVTSNAKSDDVEIADISAFTPPPVQISQLQTAVSFDLKTRYNIPSDNKQHGVIVAQYELPADYTYYAAPKMQTKAFLLAKTSDWHQYNLIPGRSNFFFQNTFVGNAMLNLSGMQDTLDISLGRDDNILMERKRVKDFCKVYAIGADKREEIGIRTTITNNKTIEIEMIVEDQTPVTTSNQIEVSLLSSKRAIYNEHTGKLKWVIKLKPGETKDLNFSYSIKYPKDRKINL